MSYPGCICPSPASSYLMHSSSRALFLFTISFLNTWKFSISSNYSNIFLCCGLAIPAFTTIRKFSGLTQMSPMKLSRISSIVFLNACFKIMRVYLNFGKIRCGFLCRRICLLHQCQRPGSSHPWSCRLGPSIRGRLRIVICNHTSITRNKLLVKIIEYCTLSSLIPGILSSSYSGFSSGSSLICG